MYSFRFSKMMEEEKNQKIKGNESFSFLIDSLISLLNGVPE